MADVCGGPVFQAPYANWLDVGSFRDWCEVEDLKTRVTTAWRLEMSHSLASCCAQALITLGGRPSGPMGIHQLWSLQDQCMCQLKSS